MPQTPEHRRAEIVGNLAAVRSRIADACEAAGRDPRSVTLIAVTKTFPSADAATLAELGVLDIGENRDQEARAKVAELAETSRVAASIRWHMIGRVQTNKARSVVSYAHAVHSVDRAKLARALSEAAVGHGRTDPLDVFVQVSLDADPERGGVLRADVGPLCGLVDALPLLRLRGVMAVAPLDTDPGAAFAELAAIAREVRERHPEADRISAGMTGDLEAAIRHGSTHVRVGSALLGRRSPVFG